MTVRRIAQLVLPLSIAAAPAAHAGEVVQQFGYEFRSFRGFDGSLGKLENVKFTLDFYGDATLNLTSLVDDGRAYNARIVTSLGVLHNGVALEDVSINGFATKSGNVVRPDPSIFTHDISYSGGTVDPFFDDVILPWFTPQQQAAVLASFYTDDYLDIFIRGYNNGADIEANVTYAEPTGFPFNFGFNAKSGTAFYTGTVTYVYSAVAGIPEPSAWLLLIAGFGAVGAGMRRRQVQGTPASA